MSIASAERVDAESAEVLSLFLAICRPRALADPYPLYARLRQIAPVLVLHLPGTAPRYLVTSFTECSQMLRDQRFGPLREEDRDTLDPSWREHPYKRRMYRSMLFRVGAEHRLRRSFATRHFTPSRTADRRREIGVIVDELLDRLAEQGAGGAPVDIEEALAVPYSSLVIGRLLGIPDEEALRLGRHRNGSAILELACLPAQRRQMLEAGEELDRGLVALVEERRRRPQDDLLSDLVREHGADEEELACDVLLLFGAGLDSPASLVGLGTQLFLDHPDQARAVRDDPTIAGAAAEEILRYEPPIQMVTRIARDEVRLGNVTIGAGSLVLALLAGANRDPAHVPHPDRFDVRRPPASGLSFAGGAHYCLGSAIARLQCELLFPPLLRRFPDMAPAGAPRYRSPGSVLRGLDHLPVRLTPPPLTR